MFKNLFRKKSIEKLVRESEEDVNPLKKVLSVKDLTFMGIAAVVGAGIFSTIGSAAYNGRPGVSLLFTTTDTSSVLRNPSKFLLNKVILCF